MLQKTSFYTAWALSGLSDLIKLDHEKCQMKLRPTQQVLIKPYAYLDYQYITILKIALPNCY